MEEEKFSYPVYSARVDEEIKDWLKNEGAKFKSQNLFFREIKRRYEVAKKQGGARLHENDAGKE